MKEVINMEILFKAKIKDTGEWVEGWYCRYSFGRWSLRDCIIPSEKAKNGQYEHIEIDPDTICRYTELRDCKGKPIFENDIVTIENTKKQGLPGVIVYNRLSASFELARDGYNSIRLDYFEYGKSEFVVIGNIHDKG